MVPTIVVIDDDKELLDYLQELFKTTEEMNVKGFTSGLAGLKYLKNETPKLILLDLGLEDIHGSCLLYTS